MPEGVRATVDAEEAAARVPARVGLPPEAFLEHLGSTGSAALHGGVSLARPPDLLALQRMAGNSAVLRLLRTSSDTRSPGRTSHSSVKPASPAKTFVEDQPLTFRAVIPRRAELASPHGGTHGAAGVTTTAGIESTGYQDAMPGGDVETGVQEVEQASRIPPPIPEPAEGATVALPDIELPGPAAIRERDTVASALTYNRTITQSGPEPSDSFGETSPYDFRMEGITVTSAPGTYTVSATVRNPIVFQVRSSTGPAGQVDIEGDSDPDITQGNYKQVSSDLSPNTSDLNGRPPRTQFWAKDLTVIHERFHATDGATHSQSGVTLAQNWLNSQSAASVADVNTLVGQVPARVIAVRRAAMTYPGREQRAYRDGAPLYTARANAIKTKGDGGGYPRLSRGARAAAGALGGAALGAGVGALAGGPLGAAIGAGIGAVAGGLIGLFM